MSKSQASVEQSSGLPGRSERRTPADVVIDVNASAVLERSTVYKIPLLMTLLLLMAFPAWVGADEPPLRGSYLLNGRQMRRAFREVVEEPRRWTVQFLSQDKPVCLGTIVDAEGWIVTKASQMKSADRCQLSDGRRISYELVGIHPSHDLALIRIRADRLQSVVWEESAPAIGEWFVSAGTGQIPVSVGVMSVPRRAIPRSETFGVLGVRLEAEQVPRINEVFPNSGAAAAKLQQGDLILEINQRPIADRPELINTLRRYRPGDTLELKIQRNEEEQSVAVTLTHPFGDFLSRIAFQNQMGGELSFRRDEFESVYQHDAVLAPEECGGPVVTLSGKALGINIARGGRTESYVLPADLILTALDELKEGKYPPSGPEGLTSTSTDSSAVVRPGETGGE